MEPLSLEYFAGLFDGEGSVSINKSRSRHGTMYHKLVLQLTMCDEALVRLVHFSFGGGVYRINRLTKTGLVPYKWMLEGPRALLLLKHLEPLLQSKRNLVDVATRFQATFHANRQLSQEDRELREQLQVELKALNARN
jgi:hypothetical protein